MKTIILIAINLIALPLFSQQYYARSFDFFNKNSEVVRDFVLNKDTIVVRGSVYNCVASMKSCTFLGHYSTVADSFINMELADQIQTGPSLLALHDNYYLSSQASPLYENITIHKVGLDFELKDSKDLRLPDPRYYFYTIKKSIKFGDRLVIGGQVSDSLDKVFISGNWVDKEKATLYVVDGNLNIDTVILISPTLGLNNKIEDMAVGSDSILYISFFQKRFTGTYLEYIKVIYGFDRHFKQVFFWSGPDIDNQYGGSSPILVGQDSTIYMTYHYNYRTYLFALNQDGTKKWECPFDSTFIQGGFYGLQLMLAKNGDIIGAGHIQSAFHGIGNAGYLFRISPNGVMKWNKVIRVNKGIDINPDKVAFGFSSWFNCLIELENNDIVAGGRIKNFQGNDNPLGAYNVDLWIVRTDSNGCIWKDCPYIQDIVTKNNYLPIVTHQNEWIVDFVPLTGSSEIRQYTFSKDTTLKNGKYYREFIYKNISSSNWVSTGEFYREKNGAVYKIGGVFTGNTEREIFDFNAGIGDTLVSNILLSQGQRKVVGVGTITLLDGVPRKKMLIGGDDCFGNITLIEGMGDSDYIYAYEAFCTPILDGSSIRIRCFSTDGKLIYKRPDLSGCYTSSINDLSGSFMQIVPNPANNIISITVPEFHNSETQTLQITNPLGQILQTQTITGGQAEIDISRLPAGLIFVQILEKGKIKAIGKVVIQH